jgi:hypothetical protein
MGSTIPYCDIVVTEKSRASHVQRSGLGERLDTVVLSHLADSPSIFDHPLRADRSHPIDGLGRE